MVYGRLMVCHAYKSQSSWDLSKVGLLVRDAGDAGKCAEGRQIHILHVGISPKQLDKNHLLSGRGSIRRGSRHGECSDLHPHVGNLDAEEVPVVIESRPDFQAGAGCGRGDESTMAWELTRGRPRQLPGDVAEHAVLDPIPRA